MTRVPEFIAAGLCKNITEEVAILASRLPELYQKFGPREELLLALNELGRVTRIALVEMDYEREGLSLGNL